MKTKFSIKYNEGIYTGSLDWSDVFGENSGRNLIAELLYEANRKAYQGFSEKLEQYIKDNLKQFGYTFVSQDNFYDFCKKRVVRISDTDNPHNYELWLDYHDSKRKLLIGIYNDVATHKHEDNKITITIG